MRIFTALAFVIGAAVMAAPGETASYDNLFVFGDSLVDSGNARIASGDPTVAPPTLGYFQGRFSNGYNFADQLSFRMGDGPATASLLGGTNYSFGGAQAAERVGDASPSFVEQLGSFHESGRTIGANDLVLVTLGGNDVRYALSSGNVNLNPAVAALTAGLNDLIGSGARNILVTGVPDVGAIPAVTLLNNPAATAAGRALSIQLNTAFDGAVGDLVTATGYNLQFFDFFGFQQRLYANPAAYGLPTPLDTTRSCLVQAPSAAPACTGFVYFDTIHPTTAIHRVIGDALAAQAGVIPEPATWGMLVLGFGLVGAAARRRRGDGARRLTAASRRGRIGSSWQVVAGRANRPG